MAITRPIDNPAVSQEERTWRANIETPRDGNYSIQVYRETILRSSDETVTSVVQNYTPINRSASAIAAETVTLPNGTVVPAALVLGALPLFFDRWADEDAARAVPGEAPFEGPPGQA